MRGRRGARLRHVAIGSIVVLAIVTLTQLLDFAANWLGLGGNSYSVSSVIAVVAVLFVIWRMEIRRERRVRRLLRENCCLACEYDLSGNTTGICPECGTPVSGRIQLVCEECGERVALPAETRGTVQLCPRCGKPGDVPNVRRDG